MTPPARPDGSPTPPGAHAPATRSTTPRSGAAGLTVGILLGTALLLYGVAAWLDGIGLLIGGGPGLSGADREAALDTVGNAAEVTAGLLAIVITVVAIVVELAATRYTHRITELFVREPVNVAVLSFFVLTTVLSLWVAATFDDQPGADAVLPNAGLWLPLVMLTGCLIILLPYFAFVFAFVSPLNTIRRLKARAAAAIRLCARKPRDIEANRARVLDAVEELADLARGSLQHKDRSIAMEVTDAFADLLREFWQVREQLPDAFFALDGAVAHDPDFVSIDAKIRDRLSRSGNWLDVKILRQFLEIFNNSLHGARDVGSFLAVTTRNLAVESNDERGETLSLCVQFFNSYLRAAINGRDHRLAYYVLDRYRQLAEDLVDRGDAASAVEIGTHMRYYGLIAYNANLGFLLETVAYDLFRLIEHAQRHESDATDPLLDVFLEVDRPEEPVAGGEDRLLAVRRIQVQLAASLLARGDHERARRIQDDLRSERRERLALIHQELGRDTRPDYWEFSDRGVNFAHLPPEQRPFLDAFFAEIDGLPTSAPVPASAPESG